METNKNSRRELLKKIPLAIAFAMGITGFVFSKGRKKSSVENVDYPSPDIKLMSKEEANEIIKNSKSLAQIRIAPGPVPDETQKQG